MAPLDRRTILVFHPLGVDYVCSRLLACNAQLIASKKYPLFRRYRRGNGISADLLPELKIHNTSSTGWGECSSPRSSPRSPVSGIVLGGAALHMPTQTLADAASYFVADAVKWKVCFVKDRSGKLFLFIPTKDEASISSALEKRPYRPGVSKVEIFAMPYIPDSFTTPLDTFSLVPTKEPSGGHSDRISNATADFLQVMSTNPELSHTHTDWYLLAELSNALETIGFADGAPGPPPPPPNLLGGTTAASAGSFPGAMGPPPSSSARGGARRASSRFDSSSTDKRGTGGKGSLRDQRHTAPRSKQTAHQVSADGFTTVTRKRGAVGPPADSRLTQTPANNDHMYDVDTEDEDYTAAKESAEAVLEDGEDATPKKRRLRQTSPRQGQSISATNTATNVGGDRRGAATTKDHTTQAKSKSRNSKSPSRTVQQRISFPPAPPSATTPPNFNRYQHFAKDSEQEDGEIMEDESGDHSQDSSQRNTAPNINQQQDGSQAQEGDATTLPASTPVGTAAKGDIAATTGISQTTSKPSSTGHVQSS